MPSFEGQQPFKRWHWCLKSKFTKQHSKASQLDTQRFLAVKVLQMSHL